MKSFFSPVVDGYSLEEDKRTALEYKFVNQSLENSVDELLMLNPEGVGELDIKNPRRVLNAWIRCVASGMTVLELKSEFEQKVGPFDHFNKKLVVLSRPKEELELRVAKRVAVMLQAGLVNEVQGLLLAGIEGNLSACRSIGYRETIAFIQGEIGEEELADLIAQNTRRLLKKQRTWFGRFLPKEAVMDISESGSDSEIAWKHIKKTA